MGFQMWFAVVNSRAGHGDLRKKLPVKPLGTSKGKADAKHKARGREGTRTRTGSLGLRRAGPPPSGGPVVTFNPLHNSKTDLIMKYSKG